MVKRPLLVLLAIATVTNPLFAAPALAQTTSANASTTDGCALATNILAQLPAIPTTLAPATANDRRYAATATYCRASDRRSAA